MNSYYAMVIHRAVVAGEPTDLLDVSAYFYLAETEDEVRDLIEQEEPTSYVGGYGDDVTWRLVRVLSIDQCSRMESGAEVIGFIASNDEIVKLD